MLKSDFGGEMQHERLIRSVFRHAHPAVQYSVHSILRMNKRSSINLPRNWKMAETRTAYDGKGKWCRGNEKWMGKILTYHAAVASRNRGQRVRSAIKEKRRRS
jgi:hypothetical protein